MLLLLSAQADTQAGRGLRQLATTSLTQLSCSRKALLCACPPPGLAGVLGPWQL